MRLPTSVRFLKPRPGIERPTSTVVPVGFVMLSWNVVPQPPRIIGPWFLWKLLVDERHQHRGYGPGKW